MERLCFGTAGIPLSTKKRGTPEGITRVRELGLDAMELEFVRGVRMGDALAEKVRMAARKNGVVLTAHGPYYVNLASEKDDVRIKSMERILNTARVLKKCGGRSFTFHAGYYYKDDSNKTYDIMKDALEKVVEILAAENNDVRVCPEVMGKTKSFGKLPEILRLCEEVEGIHPCIDFAHLHALDGAYNTYKEFANVFENMESRLGAVELKNLHIHVSGIEYGPRGEKRHLELEKSDLNYRDLVKTMKDFDCAGVVICESPSIEDDALLLQNEYMSLSD
ncbi:MAG: TIM barrel protein [Candidatus Thermoplasmatota archaeon]|jgi:deoxyribonuclease-4|nr:TIM barrel protein [Candidatus Thermoplasmatota archaeon]MDP7264063.1 TIM barrel protein [Candidatus Thermoplasmatota archaeon]MDP7423377.1 TIM barrel protein [bacterium]